MLDVNDSARLSISLATAEQIRTWSNGEVKKPETINYRTLKPEKDGLFCEKIFGPTKDWECYCGKYKRVRFKGIMCERCGVEVTRSKVRRERMGHIELAAPVTHIWYFKGVPSRLGYLLDIAPKSLEKVIYFAANLITWVDEEKLHTDLPSIETEIKAEIGDEENRRDLEIEKLFAGHEAEVTTAEEGRAKKAELDKLRKASEREVEEVREKYQADIDFLTTVYNEIRTIKPKKLIDDERVWREVKYRWSEYFAGGMGAEAVKDLISRLDLEAEEVELKEIIATAKGQRKAKAIKRLKVISAFNRSGEDGRPVNSPMGMVLDSVPVIPPDLRPMVQLDGGRFATSDLNDLYRRVINRNNRLKRLLDLGAPEIIINNEKRMLQEAVDALFDNGRRGRPVTGPGNRPLKSLSDMLKGKQGRFRQNLLGKRVDYSGRSVIVVGPTLKLRQCGLPKQMALELFKPFVMKRLVDLEFAQNIKSAKRMVERSRPQVWDVLEDVIKEHPVFLNRAPTLHRLGIQAFEPVLIEGKAIQIHPLVCAAFNADFDGDQMAVHLPLSSEAQAEARLLMLSAHNILSPAHGRPVSVPSQDMIIGAFYLTEVVEGGLGEGRVFSTIEEARMAYELGNELSIHALIKVRVPTARFPVDAFPVRDAANPESPVIRRGGDNGDGWVIAETSLGRLLFNEAFPPDFPFKNCVAKKAALSDIVGELVDGYTKSEVAASLDALKDLGFDYSTRSGITISISDVRTPSAKAEILARHEDAAEKVEAQYFKGIITDDERRQKEIEIWTDATNQVTEAMQKEQSAEQFNPIEMMVGSGARGNVMQVRQIAGMRGLVANPRGEIIPRPIKSNFREGLSVLEYFISTHGARKGLADTALRTADSGYLTRRLVDVAQELIVRDEDCGSVRGIWVEGVSAEREHVRAMETNLLGRCLADDVKLKDGTSVVRNTEVTEEVLAQLTTDENVTRVRVRSVLTCEYPRNESTSETAPEPVEEGAPIEKYRAGVCTNCYGTMLATGKLVDQGEAIGIIAAQSIGEPGTQLTMRTFHTGGVAGEDITHGLPRVVELFEARTPKGAALLAESSGVVRIGENEKGERTLTVVGDDGAEEIHVVSIRTRLALGIDDGVEVLAGAQLTGDEKSSRDPKKVLDIEGIRTTQQYLVDQVQRVYREQGVSIHDKHVEVIVRQMLRRVGVSDPGDSTFLPGQKADARLFANTNKQLVSEGKRPAEGRPELMGITKASLATESWLSAASFQETTRVLTEAAIEGKNDGLEGLKENVIIGKLIPAGTGMPVYRDVATEAPDYEPLEFYSSDYDDVMDLAERLRASHDLQAAANEASRSSLQATPGNDAEMAAEADAAAVLETAKEGTESTVPNTKIEVAEPTVPNTVPEEIPESATGE
ncbi:MAG: DNA-directed RNA polymerase subunit beta' [Acidimicrobiia bacterium]|nr:DNA-directed RNA polymerase subunit beta' [Acidimicrobiia bacterium]